MSGKTVLITGISGFIAQNLASRLLDDGDSVIGISRTSPGSELIARGMPFIAGDVTNADQMHQIVSSIEPNAVYHLAAHSVLTGSTAAEMLRINGSGTVNVLEACRQCEVPVCIVASSDKQYGALAEPPYSDNDTTSFLNGGVYELSKSQQDQIGRLFAGLYDVPSVRVARLVNIYGPRDTQWSRIVPGTILRCVRGEPARITEGRAGAAVREYIYVDDAVEALKTVARSAAEEGNEPYRVPYGKLAAVGFNVAGGTRMKAAEVIHVIRQTLQNEFGISSPEPVLQPGPVGVFEPGSQYNEDGKIKQIFQDRQQVYRPISFTEGLRKTIPWYIEHLL